MIQRLTIVKNYLKIISPCCGGTKRSRWRMVEWSRQSPDTEPLPIPHPLSVCRTHRCNRPQVGGIALQIGDRNHRRQDQRLWVRIGSSLKSSMGRFPSWLCPKKGLKFNKVSEILRFMSGKNYAWRVKFKIRSVTLTSNVLGSIYVGSYQKCLLLLQQKWHIYYFSVVGLLLFSSRVGQIWAHKRIKNGPFTTLSTFFTRF